MNDDIELTLTEEWFMQTQVPGCEALPVRLYGSTVDYEL